jgi:diacylglycerol kinase (ATP)
VRATLIYNANAAGRFRLSTERILELLAAVGYDAEHVPTESEAELTAALRDPGELVIAAGGDGTVRGVALALAERPGPSVPLAIIPLGTANNIARTLALTDTAEALIRSLATPQRRPFDLGCVRAPWGASWFLEAFGFGLFAYGMAHYAPAQGKSLFRALRATVRALTRYEARSWQLELDGEDISGRYLNVELMNTAAMGLRLPLAPGADPSDGLFEVVRIAEDDTVGLKDYLSHLAAGTLVQLPNVTVTRGRHLVMHWDGSPLHFDEEVHGEAFCGGEAGVSGGVVQSGTIDVDLEAGALELWLPGNLEPQGEGIVRCV